MCDIVCEEVVEGNIVLGYLWEGVKLIFFGFVSKVFWNVIGRWCMIGLYIF